MLRKLALAIGILSIIAACAVPRTKLDTNPAYTAHHFANHEVEMSWKTENTDKGVRIDGTVKNVRPDLPYTALQVTAKALDENGKVLGKGSKAFEGRFAGSEPFTIEIPLPQKENVKKINFSYSYGTTEDFHRNEFDSVP